MIFRLGTSPVRNTRSVHGECPCFHHGNPLEGLRPPGLDGDLLESFDGPGRVALLGFERGRRSRSGRDRSACCREVGMKYSIALGKCPAIWLVRPIAKRSRAARGSWRGRAWDSKPQAALGSGWITDHRARARRAKA